MGRKLFEDIFGNTLWEEFIPERKTYRIYALNNENQLVTVPEIRKLAKLAGEPLPKRFGRHFTVRQNKVPIKKKRYFRLWFV